MKVLGIIGGLGPESTIDYYRMILARLRERGAPPGSSLLINSLDLDYVRGLIEIDNRPKLIRVLAEAVEVLARAGADLGLFAANTPHLVFDEVASRAPIPMVSIMEATADEVEARGLKRVGLLGTGFTMEGRFYPEVFSRRGLPIVVPGPEDRAYVHQKYLGELVPGVFLDATREGFRRVMDRMRERDGVDGIILGGTELPLLLRGVEYPVPLLDTGRIHVDAALARCVD